MKKREEEKAEANEKKRSSRRLIRAIILISAMLIIYSSVIIILNFNKVSFQGFKEIELPKKENWNINKDIAIASIEGAEQDIEKIKDYGFSVNNASINLILAKEAFQKAEYADKIMNNASLFDEVKKQLGKNFTNYTFYDNYDRVIDYTYEINIAMLKAANLQEKKVMIKNKIEDYRSLGIDVLDIPIDELNNLLKSERYDDANELVAEIIDKFEVKSQKYPVLFVISLSLKSIFLKYWIWIFIISYVIAYYIWQKIEIMRFKRSLERGEI